MKKSILSLLLVLSISFILHGQEEEIEDHSYKPLKVSLNESGSKYIRFLMWHQIWAEDQNLDDNVSRMTMRIRRSRFIVFSQISPRFMILTHFGLNTLTSGNMDPIGDGRSSNAPQLFLHAAWNEFKVSSDESLYIGTGLHYWNGLSRLTSQSTLNFMTLDNYRLAWSQLGLSDQFARHVGVYAKGKIGKLRYTIAANDPISNALGSDDEVNLSEGSVTYSGKRIFGKDAGLILTGYLDFQFRDQESNKLPYRVGTYLGEKEVLNVGFGFFNHSNGAVLIENQEPIGQDVTHFSADVFYDAPLGNGAINAYGSFYSFDYGPKYTLGSTYGTGNALYSHLGYLLPFQSKKGYRFMPYVAYCYHDFDAFENAGQKFHIGANWFINGHHAKITAEFTSTLQNYTGTKPDRVNGLVIQTQIFL